MKILCTQNSEVCTSYTKFKQLHYTNCSLTWKTVLYSLKKLQEGLIFHGFKAYCRYLYRENSTFVKRVTNEFVLSKMFSLLRSSGS